VNDDIRVGDRFEWRGRTMNEYWDEGDVGVATRWSLFGWYARSERTGKEVPAALDDDWQWRRLPREPVVGDFLDPAPTFEQLTKDAGELPTTAMASAESPPRDCGDNSCKYAKTRTGMRTNGGCRCDERADDELVDVVCAYLKRSEGIVFTRVKARALIAIIRPVVLEEAAALCDEKYRRGDGAGKWYAMHIRAMAKEGT
jgi:hypothetical protein